MGKWGSGVALAVCGIAAVVVAAAGAGNTRSSAAETAGFRSVVPKRAFVPGELIVGFAPGARADVRASVLRAEGATLKDDLRRPRAALVRLAPGETVVAATASFEARPGVAYAEPNYIYRASATPNDVRFGELWGLNQANDADIDGPQAWDVTTGSPSVRVAVVDTGVAYQHPDLAPNMAAPVGYDFVDDDAFPFDPNGHGTHVAGTIGAPGNNGLGVVGVNWDVSLLAVRAGDAGGSFTAAAIADGFDYACTSGADVVNGSFGGSAVSQIIYDAVAACPGTLFVFAAGNSGQDLGAVGSYPCEYHLASGVGAGLSNVLCIGATNQYDELADFSNYGDQEVHFAGPGVATLSTWPGSQTIWGDTFDGSESDFDLNWGDRTGPLAHPLWSRTTALKTSGTHSLTDSPVGPYANDTDTTIRRLGPFSLAGQSGCRIDYDMLLDTEFGFDPFLIYAGTTASTPDLVDGWWGSTDGEFFDVSSDFSAYDSFPVVYLRLGLQSDDVENFDGVYLDDVAVRCILETAEDYKAISGTSMATPHAAGVAALLFAQNPARSVADVKAALIAGLDIVPGLTSTSITGGRLNACKALGRSAAECGGPPPPPPPPPPPLPPPPPPPPLPPPPPPQPPPQRPPAARRCVVPSVRGRTVPQARRLLTAVRCRLGSTRRAYSRTRRRGRIISQSRRPGARLAVGTRVNVVVSRGRRPRR